MTCATATATAPQYYYAVADSTGEWRDRRNMAAAPTTPSGQPYHLPASNMALPLLRAGTDDRLSFVTHQRHASLVYAVYGDFGHENDVSLARLNEELRLGAFQAVLHIGDLACECAVAAEHARMC